MDDSAIAVGTDLCEVEGDLRSNCIRQCGGAMAGVFTGFLGEDHFERVSIKARLTAVGANCALALDHETAIRRSPRGTAAKQPPPVEAVIGLAAGIDGCQRERGRGNEGDCPGGQPENGKETSATHAPINV